MKTTSALPIVLELLTVTANDLGFRGFANGKQPTNIITDGSFAIKRDALIGKTKLPSYILTALNAQLDEGLSHASVEALAGNYAVTRMQAVEPMGNQIGAIVDGTRKVTATMELIHYHTGDKTAITVNAKLLKVLWAIFPQANWYLAPSKMLCLVSDSEILAVLSPIQTK